MVDNLVRARVSEAGAGWLERKIAESHAPDAARNGYGWHDEVIKAAFEAGAEWADENFADRRRIGQRQLEDAGALMRETSELLRGYETHHRDKVAQWEARIEETSPDGNGAVLIANLREAITDTLAKAERNALAAARLEAWLRGDDQFPTTSGDVEPLRARQAASSDPDTYDSHHQIAGLAAPAGRRPPGRIQATLLNDTIGLRVTKRGGDYEFDGEIRAVIIKRSGAIRYAVEDDRGLLLVMNAAQCGVPDSAPLVVACRGGVADLGAFRLTTGDPRFDPTRPVCVNGFRYEPTKESCDE